MSADEVFNRHSLAFVTSYRAPSAPLELLVLEDVMSGSQRGQWKDLGTDAEFLIEAIRRLSPNYPDQGNPSVLDHEMTCPSVRI